MIKIVDGDLLQSNLPLIAHQTNCLGVMGAGIAKSIKNKWSLVYTQYTNFCKLLKCAKIRTHEDPFWDCSNRKGL